MESLRHLTCHNFLPLSCLSGLFLSKALEAETLNYFPSTLQYLLLLPVAVLGIMNTERSSDLCVGLELCVSYIVIQKMEDYASLYTILRQLIHNTQF